MAETGQNAAGKPLDGLTVKLKLLVMRLELVFNPAGLSRFNIYVLALIFSTHLS